jgi:hypothetical protein
MVVMVAVIVMMLMGVTVMMRMIVFMLMAFDSGLAFAAAADGAHSDLLA